MSSNFPALISGRFSKETSNSKSSPSLNAVILMSGIIAGRRFLSLISSSVDFLTKSSKTSPLTEAAYFCFSIETGAFPARKPGSLTVLAISLILASTSFSKSWAGTITLYSFFKPSDFNSVTFILFFSKKIGLKTSPVNGTGADGGTWTPTACATRT